MLATTDNTHHNYKFRDASATWEMDLKATAQCPKMINDASSQIIKSLVLQAYIDAENTSQYTLATYNIGLLHAQR